MAGCAGGGPRWRWLSPMPHLAPMTDQDVVVAIVGDLLSPDALSAYAKASLAPAAPRTASAAPSTVADPARRTDDAREADGVVE